MPIDPEVLIKAGVQAQKEQNKLLERYDIADFRNYLIQRFNDYEVPLEMTAEEVRELIIKFSEEYDNENNQLIGKGNCKFEYYRK